MQPEILDHLDTKNIEDDKEMLKEIYISPQKRQQTTNKVIK